MRLAKVSLGIVMYLRARYVHLGNDVIKFMTLLYVLAKRAKK